MEIYNSFTDLVGKTPLMRLSNIIREYSLKADILAKLEYFNPAGSVKDRIAKSMIEAGEKEGKINKDTLIIEPTSGNTGIGLAAVCASKGYKILLVMPDTMSIERRSLLKAYGAKLVLTDGKLGMKGAMAKANELARGNENSFIPSQFDNPMNPKAHKDTTGPEIWQATGGKVDILVSGVGTGGTLTGAGEYLKEMNKGIKVIAIEPEDSPILSKGLAGPHKIQGIGAGFIPNTLNTSIYDEVIRVTNDQAFEMTRALGRKEGILVGISAGAAMQGAITVASREENKGKTLVVILPDTGERYLSAGVFNEDE